MAGKGREDIDTQLMQAKKNLSLKFIRAVLLFAEDPGFFHHPGLSPHSIINAYLHNRIYKKLVGGSGLAQQLAGILYFRKEINYLRKIKEGIAAVSLVQIQGREWILRQYFDKVYCGLPQPGLYNAARGYFHCELEELDIYELFMLIAILPGPDKNSPSVYPKDALAARGKLIFKLYCKKIINFSEAWQANVLNKQWDAAVTERIQKQLVGLYDKAQKYSINFNRSLPKDDTGLKVINR